MYSPFDPTDEEAGYPEEPRCPLCHERCDTIYRTDDGAIVGCDRCIVKVEIVRDVPLFCIGALDVPDVFSKGTDNLQPGGSLVAVIHIVQLDSTIGAVAEGNLGNGASVFVEFHVLDLLDFHGLEAALDVATATQMFAAPAETDCSLTDEVGGMVRTILIECGADFFCPLVFHQNRGAGLADFAVLTVLHVLGIVSKDYLFHCFALLSAAVRCAGDI